MITLDFSQIRIHDGSQQNGFEELICQLAHLEPPRNANYFVRKDGAGGDAGVECYWKLNDGTEVAWQAKYFINILKTTQWNEITSSVNSFLEKHPEVTVYYVCLPRDWNDSRKKGKSGKQVKSNWDYWLEYKQKWEDKAKELQRNVDFRYWCKHEISQRLQRKDPKYAGRAEYWFNIPILTTKQFNHLFEKSRVSLGERYDEENHMALPVSEYFDSITYTEKWKNKVISKLRSWKKSCQFYEKKLVKDALDFYKNLKFDIAEEVKEVQECFSKLLAVSTINARQHTTDYLELIDRLHNSLKSLEKLFLINSSQSHNQIFLNSFSKFESSIVSISNFLNSKLYSLSNSGFGIITGAAGAGKSHLLCDYVLQRLDQELPTIFLLGQHYSGGDPISWIRDSIDLSQFENDIFLGALDSAAEAYKSNALIVIDAINEGMHRDDWINHIINLYIEKQKYPNIKLIISCRDTHLDYLVPDELPNRSEALIKHEGYRGIEQIVARKYLAKFGISMPNIPILAPEFSNPLFLRTCCKSLRANGLHSFPKDLKGIVKLFNFYLAQIERVIAKVKKYQYLERIVEKSLIEFARQLYPDNTYGLEISIARDFFRSYDPNPGIGEGLFNLLIDEGVISEDISFINKQPTPVIRFTYERFSDYFIAENICSVLNESNLEESFQEGGELFDIVDNDLHNDNILSVVSIIVAEKFGVELVDLLSKEKLTYGLFKNIFTETLVWRSPNTFTKKTLDWLGYIKNVSFRSPSHDVVLNFAVDPKHPWNAYFIHKKLINMNLPDRDAFWTTHVNISDLTYGENYSSSIIRQLIDWGYKNTFKQVEEEQIKLYCITLIWFTSSSNRKIRDQSTKSAVSALITMPHVTLFLLNNFSEVNDLYVLERLYAIAYGVITNIDNKEIIKQIANRTSDKLFSNDNVIPHILLRDYGSGILEYAFQKGLLDEKYNPESHRLPFKSTWPLDDPELGYFEKEEIKTSSIKDSIMGFIGDFGNYTMGRVHDWSPSSINKSPITKLELLELFVMKVSGESREIIKKYIDHEKSSEKSRKLSYSYPFNLEAINLDTWAEDSKKHEVPDIDEWLENDGHNKTENESEPEFSFNNLKQKLEKDISRELLEELRWIHGLSALDSIASISRKKAHRWVCKRAFDLGWSSELFNKYEQLHCPHNRTRSTSSVERIGKKYQWIAYYEYLAYLSDNRSYIDRGYDDEDNSRFYGPWQIHVRDLDPTFLERKTNNIGWNNGNYKCWWLNNDHDFYGVTLQDKQAWLWDRKNTPNFKEIVNVKHLHNDNDFIILRGFSKIKKASEQKDLPYQEIWYRINSCIIKKQDSAMLKKAIKKYNLRNPDILAPSSSGHQRFIREFPWHPNYKDSPDWEKSLSYGIKENIDHLIPTSIYEWEAGSTDYSVDESISIYMPSKELVKSLGLKNECLNSNRWIKSDNELVFLDPSICESGPSVALINKEVLLKWLEDNDYELVWLIGGEKQMFSENANKFYGRLIFNSLLSYSGKQIQESRWFNESHPQMRD